MGLGVREPVASCGNLWQLVGNYFVGVLALLERLHAGGLQLGCLQASGETVSLDVARMMSLRMRVLMKDDKDDN